MINKTITAALLFMLALNSALAQQSSKQVAIDEMIKLADKYKASPYLSFDISYYYSKEETPGIYLDSLKGSFRLQGKRSWYSMDSTESISSDSITVVLFKEDRMMYLTRSSQGSATGNPLAVLDSILQNNKDIECSLTISPKEQIIALRFKPGMLYKRIEYFVDKKSGLLTRIRSVVKSDQLYDSSVRDLVTDNNSYAIVESVYSDYKKGRFDEHIFDMSRYFKLVNNEYVSVAPYNDYKIFIGTPTL